MAWHYTCIRSCVSNLVYWKCELCSLLQNHPVIGKVKAALSCHPGAARLCQETHVSMATLHRRCCVISTVFYTSTFSARCTLEPCENKTQFHEGDLNLYHVNVASSLNRLAKCLIYSSNQMLNGIPTN